MIFFWLILKDIRADFIYGVVIRINYLVLKLKMIKNVNEFIEHWMECSSNYFALAKGENI